MREFLSSPPDRRVEALGQEFRQLSPEDQDLILALVARLRVSEGAEFPPDVPFMDFDE
ncbi:MAG: hypothetical protein M3083_14210 [Actinomycetota bacterium]|nr:hypothetical protein [Actinomycetota bacterium]